VAFAVELNFDSQTEEIIRRAWQRLAVQGISRSMIEARSRPHVTLSVAREIDEAAFVEWLHHFALQFGRFDLLFQSIGLFPTTEGVVFFAPTVTRALLDVHQRFYGAQPDSWRHLVAYYTPEHWVPHCTAAVYLSPNQIPSAMAICMETAMPIQGQFTAMTLIESHPRRPIRELTTVPFAT
jgi:hypothetical protein